MVEGQRWAGHSCHAGLLPLGEAFHVQQEGFNYFGVDELTKVWEHYAKGPPRLIQTVAVSRLVVGSDIAWLLCELKYRRVSPVTSEGHWEPTNTDQVFGSKATEIYHRDDGNGKPSGGCGIFTRVRCSQTRSTPRVREDAPTGYVIILKPTPQLRLP